MDKQIFSTLLTEKDMGSGTVVVVNITFDVNFLVSTKLLKSMDTHTHGNKEKH